MVFVLEIDSKMGFNSCSSPILVINTMKQRQIKDNISTLLTFSPKDKGLDWSKYTYFSSISSIYSILPKI